MRSHSSYRNFLRHNAHCLVPHSCVTPHSARLSSNSSDPLIAFSNCTSAYMTVRDIKSATPPELSYNVGNQKKSGPRRCVIHYCRHCKRQGLVRYRPFMALFPLRSKTIEADSRRQDMMNSPTCLLTLIQLSADD